MALKFEHTLLLVDDEKAITRALHRLFRKEGYNIITASSGREGLEKLQQSDVPVSLIISDQRMPEMNGATFLEKAKSIFPEAIRYLLTGYSDMDAVVQAVNQGEIHRYLTKPWNDDDLLLQVRQSLEHFELVHENRRLTELTIKQNKELSELNKNLEHKVKERTQEVYEKNEALEKINRMLEESFMDSIRLLVSLVEILNPRLGKHMRLVADMARKVGKILNLEKRELDQIEMAGMIHDIGMLGFPEELWIKEMGQMTEEELKMYSEHPVIGSIILEKVDKLIDVRELVLYHHEYLNGKGFPNGLRGDQIPLGSKIILAASDYCRIVETWPRDLQKLIKLTRRHFNATVWKSMTIGEDVETIIEDAAEKILLNNANQKYDMEVVSALIKTVQAAKNLAPTFTLELQALESGMILREDIRLNDGRLLLTKGTQLKGKTVQSIQTIGERGMIPNKVTVSIPED